MRAALDTEPPALRGSTAGSSSVCLEKNFSVADEKHFQLFSQIQRRRPAPHFSMRASSCSCRDVIWEKGARHYRKARPGLPTVPAQALLCFCGSSTYASGCFAYTWQNSALPTGEAAQQEPRSGNLLPWYLVETQKSCPGKKSAKTLQLLSVLYMGASGSLCRVLPQAAILVALDCWPDVFWPTAPSEGRLKSTPFPIPLCPSGSSMQLRMRYNHT